VTARHAAQLAAAVAGRTPDIGSHAVTLRSAVAVRPVTATDVDDQGVTGAGHPYPGWWILLDDVEVSVPVVAGTAAVEAGCPVWLLRVGDALLLLGGVTVGRTVDPEEPQPPAPAIPWIHLTRATSQTIANNTLTDVIWTADDTQGEPWASPDRAGGGSLWTAPTDVQIPIPGLWAVTLTVQWIAHATGVRYVDIEHDRGAAQVVHGAQHGVGSIASTFINAQTSHAVVNAAAGDLIRGRVQHSAGTNLDVAQASMTVHWVGPGTRA
jgi:hypothetical protein